ncbi:MAG: cobalamin B12-binding domain-containing protein [Deltaproteobacteria bacterium]|nr:cobalamin B12-binding domain-containing protein [Deltaproteobacteria bacterium]
MDRGIDIVLINPGDRKQVFQELGSELAAIEPPFWVAVMAAYLRNCGFDVRVIDSNAENISPEETAERVNALAPLLAAVIVYGSHPSASTQNMTVAGRICTALKLHTGAKVAIGGLHPSALPKRTLQDEDADFVIEGEGPHTLKGLLEALRSGGDYQAVPGLWYFEENEVKHNQKAPLIKDLDTILPVAAWDLLPMEKYRAHNWHCFDGIEERMPYGAIYTSLGCPYSCVFCCINAPFGKPGIRFRSPEVVVEEIRVLVERYGVSNIKIVDELFILNEKHYMAIADLIIKSGYKLNIWAYARVDTIDFDNLDTIKRAGINWLGLGIESANASVRDGANKQMRKNDIKEVVRRIQGSGIRVGANYIFGLPDDTLETMQETLDMAVELNTEWANFYCAMAYPGSKLYETAVREGWELPEEWHGFSQLSYETHPLPTGKIGAKEVLKFRDDAFHKYFESGRYLKMAEERFGPSVVEHVRKMTSTRLKRKMLDSKESRLNESMQRFSSYRSKIL